MQSTCFNFARLCPIAVKMAHLLIILVGMNRSILDYAEQIWSYQVFYIFPTCKSFLVILTCSSLVTSVFGLLHA
jgi:hypothetical protein